MPEIVKTLLEKFDNKGVLYSLSRLNGKTNREDIDRDQKYISFAKHEMGKMTKNDQEHLTRIETEENNYVLFF